MKDKTVHCIVPDQDSISLQDFYAELIDLVEGFNACHEAQIMELDFHLVGGLYYGEKRDYKGVYIDRERTAVVE